MLRDGGRAVHVEPLVFDLLVFFVERAGQVLARDLIIEQVWDGRIVSDATVSSCIKSARKALGDTGDSQTYIRTIRGRGFQFVANVASVPAEPEPTVKLRPMAADRAEPSASVSSAPKVAVLPLFPLSSDPEVALLGDALAQEIILELARLHWLLVVARGSAFKFRGQEIDLASVGGILGADYCVTGTIARNAGQCVISVELCRTSDAGLVWAERFATPDGEIMHMRSTIAGEIVSALETRIQQFEALQSSRVPTEHLGAWAAYHLGLWHMLRFNRQDNAIAAGLFTKAVGLDARFARAHAGLSFTHFQNAFLGFVPDTAAELAHLRSHAEKSLELDPLDPVVNLTMGRAEWLAGSLEGAVDWMERAIALSPNYAFAIYNSALIGTFLGDGDANEPKVVRAITLSPVDPLNYAMLATRALTHMVRGNYATAAEWADRAVRAPNAHVQIYAIAAFANELNGNRAKAETYVAHIRRAMPGFDRSEFLKLFPFRDAARHEEIAASLRRLGL